MILFMLLLTGLFFIMLVGVSAVQPRQSILSSFELERRVAGGDEVAREDQRHQRAYNDLYSLQRALVAVLLLAYSFCAIGALGWLAGMALSLIGAVFYGPLARPVTVRRYAQRIYEQYANNIIEFISHHQRLCRLLRGSMPEMNAPLKLESREELLHVVAGAGHILTRDERHLIQHGLAFNDRRVNEVMVSRSVVATVNRKELLGPLALNDLHQTGHSRFPVIDGDIDHVIGMLHIQDLLTLDDKKSLTAERAMESRVYYIRDIQTLQHALAAFLRTHHHLFIVINEFHETVGVLSLEDVIEALIGRRIVDEFDSHDDLRVVARRLAQAHQQPTDSHTV